MTGLSNQWGMLVLSLLSMLAGCAVEQKVADVPPNVFLKSVMEGYGYGIKKVDGVSTESFLDGMPVSTYVAPGRHDFEWELSVPMITPPFGATGATIITRCMWLDVVKGENYIVESKVNSRRALFRVRAESGGKVSWGNCKLTHD